MIAIRCRRCRYTADLCVSDAAAYLGMSPSSFYKLLRESPTAIECIEIPHKGRRWTPAALDAFRARCTKGGGAAKRTIAFGPRRLTKADVFRAGKEVGAIR